MSFWVLEIRDWRGVIGDRAGDLFTEKKIAVLVFGGRMKRGCCLVTLEMVSLAKMRYCGWRGFFSFLLKSCRFWKVFCKIESVWT